MVVPPNTRSAGAAATRPHLQAARCEASLNDDDQALPLVVVEWRARIKLAVHLVGHGVQLPWHRGDRARSLRRLRVCGGDELVGVQPKHRGDAFEESDGRAAPAVEPREDDRWFYAGSPRELADRGESGGFDGPPEVVSKTIRPLILAHETIVADSGLTQPRRSQSNRPADTMPALTPERGTHAREYR